VILFDFPVVLFRGDRGRVSTKKEEEKRKISRKFQRKDEGTQIVQERSPSSTSSRFQQRRRRKGSPLQEGSRRQVSPSLRPSFLDLEASDKEALDKAITETISWLDASAEASKEEYEEKQKELEAVANPSKLSFYSPSLSRIIH